MNILPPSEEKVPYRHSHAAGFSLVEILAVIVVIGLLVSAALPGMFSVLRATKLTSSGEIVLSRIAQAQQLAQTLNSPVELRFYTYTPPDQPGAKGAYRAVQLIDPEYADPTGTGGVDSKALSEALILPAGMVIASSRELSPLLQTPVGTAGDFFATDASAQYCALHFYPDGSFKKMTEDSSSAGAGGVPGTTGVGAVSPVLAESYLTIVSDSDVDKVPPKNFVCIQLDPYTSKARLYRP